MVADDRPRSRATSLIAWCRSCSTARLSVAATASATNAGVHGLACVLRDGMAYSSPDQVDLAVDTPDSAGHEGLAWVQTARWFSLAGVASMSAMRVRCGSPLGR